MSTSMPGSTPAKSKVQSGSKAVSPIPAGFHAVTPYLLVAGAQKFIDFAKKAFGAKEGMKMPSPDGKITHADITISDSHIMLADEMEGYKAMPVMLYLYVPDADATFKRALAAGATEIRPLENQFYGDRAGCVKDPCGNTWWIATQVEQVEGEELKQRAADAQRKMQKH